MQLIQNSGFSQNRFQSHMAAQRPCRQPGSKDCSKSFFLKYFFFQVLGTKENPSDRFNTRTTPVQPLKSLSSTHPSVPHQWGIIGAEKHLPFFVELMCWTKRCVELRGTGTKGLRYASFEKIRELKWKFLKSSRKCSHEFRIGLIRLNGNYWRPLFL